MIQHKGLLSSFSFTAMFFLGVGTAVIGAAATNIGLTPAQVGLLITAQNIGFITAVLGFGAMADMMRKPLLLAAASVITSLGFFFYYAGDLFWLNFIIMIGIGIGIGGYEAVTDALLLDIHDKREGLFITINHFFVTFGELMITLYLIFLQMQWRRSMTQSAAAVLVLALFFFFSRSPRKPNRIESLAKRLQFMKGQPGLYLMLFMAVCAVGTEIGIIGILTSFLEAERGFDQVTSKIGLVVFLSGISAGRIILSFIIRQENILKLIKLFFALAAVINTVLFFIDMPTAALYPMLALSGLAMSISFPLVITLSGLAFEEASATAMGVIKLGIPFGGIFLPLVMAGLSEIGGLPLSMLIFPGAALLGLIAAVLGHRFLKLNPAE